MKRKQLVALLICLLLVSSLPAAAFADGQSAAERGLEAIMATGRGDRIVLPKEESYLEEAFCRMELSARAYHKVLRVARTIADIDGSEDIQQIHLCEALSYRLTDGKYWQKMEE